MSITGGRAVLLQVISSTSEEEAAKRVLALCMQFTHRNNLHSCISEGLSELSEEHQEKLWQLLFGAFNTVLAHYLGDEGNNMQAEPHNGQQHNQNHQQEELQQREQEHQENVNVSEEEEVSSEAVMLCILRLAICHVGLLQPPQQNCEGNRGHAGPPHSLSRLVVVVGGVLLVLEGNMCRAAVTLCEEWSLKQLPHCSTFGRQLLSVLIRFSLEPKAKKIDIKRVYHQLRFLAESLTPESSTTVNHAGATNADRPSTVRSGHSSATSPDDVVSDTEVATINEESVGNLVDALCACLVSPVYLCCDEGVKFLGLAMTQRCVMSLGHVAVRGVLPYCSRGTAGKLAQVYCRAWRGTAGETRKTFELQCIQDLMYRYTTVNPAAVGHLPSNLLSFLHGLHTQQKLPAFATVLQRLYRPFLWRSLGYANGQVRANACALLCDAYPLEDLSASLEEREQHLTRAHGALTTALTDPSHVVRVTAIQGVCRILLAYWPVLPKTVIQEWFSLMLTKLAADASTAQGRLQVVKGLSRVLDCRDALPFLKQCLPQLGPCFDDVNAAVRVAMVRLLLRLQALKHIKYWSVVPVAHLLHRLEVDCPAVCKLLTRLLATPFLPIHRDDKEVVERCLSLIVENRAASRIFYQYVTHGLDVGSVVRVLLLLFRALRGYLQHRHRRHDSHNAPSNKEPYKKRTKNTLEGDKENLASGSSRNDSCTISITNNNSRTVNMTNNGSDDNDYHSGEDDEEEDASSNECPFDDPSVVGGVLDALVILWTFNKHKLALPHNAKWLALLQRKVARGLPLLSSSFRGSAELSRTLLHLASFLPRSHVPTLVGHCLTKLRGLSDDEVRTQLDQKELVNTSYLPYVNALCNWNRCDDLLELVEEWLREAFAAYSEEQVATVSSARRRSSDRISSRRTSRSGASDDSSHNTAHISGSSRKRSGSRRNSRRSGRSKGGVVSSESENDTERNEKDSCKLRVGHSGGSDGCGTARSVRFALNASRALPRPLVGVALVRALLLHRLNRTTVLHRHRTALLHLAEVMEGVMSCLSSRLDSVSASSSCPDEFLLACWQEYLCVVALLHQPPPAAQTSVELRRGPRRSGSSRATPSAEHVSSVSTTTPGDDQEATEAGSVDVAAYDAAEKYCSLVSWAHRVLIPKLSRNCELNSAFANVTSVSITSDTNNSGVLSNACIPANNQSSNISAQSPNTNNDTNVRTGGRKRKYTTANFASDTAKSDSSELACSTSESLASSAVCELLRMCASALATAMATPRLLAEVAAFATEVLKKDGSNDIISSCSFVATEAHQYQRTYQGRYFQYLQDQHEHQTPPCTIGSQPDVSLMQGCISALLLNSSQGNVTDVSRQVGDAVSSLQGAAQAAVAKHVVLECIRSLTASGQEHGHQSDPVDAGVSALLSMFKTRQALAGPLAAALHSFALNTQNVAERVILLHIINLLIKEPGRMRPTELQATLAAVDGLQRTRTGSSVVNIACSPTGVPELSSVPSATTARPDKEANPFREVISLTKSTRLQPGVGDEGSVSDINGSVAVDEHNKENRSDEEASASDGSKRNNEGEDRDPLCEARQLMAAMHMS